jgi:hypothetical protein
MSNDDSERQCNVAVGKGPCYSAAYLPGMGTIAHYSIATAAVMGSGRGGRGDCMAEASSSCAIPVPVAGDWDTLCDGIRTITLQLNYRAHDTDSTRPNTGSNIAAPAKSQ